jgi:hypothetical protein
MKGEICRQQMKGQPQRRYQRRPNLQAGDLRTDVLGFGPGTLLFFLGWCVFTTEDIQKVANYLITLRFVAQGKAGIDGIPNPPPFLRLAYIPAALKLSDNSSHRSLGNPDFHGQLPGGNGRMAANITQYNGVIGYKSPLRHQIPSVS